MKKQLFKLSLLLTAFAMLTLSSCKKEDTTDDSVSAQDHGNISAAMNSVSDDATSAVGQVQSLSGKTEGVVITLCGATVETSDSGNKRILITYDGTTNCGGIRRNGTVTITLSSGTHWKDPGAQLTVAFENLQVTSVGTGETYTISGSHTVTNVSGGLAWQIMNQTVVNTTVIHRHTGQMEITFPDNSHRTWTLDRTRKFISDNTSGTNIITVSVYAEGANNVDASGTNRRGDTFSNSILQPITVSSTSTACGNNWMRKPVSGEFKHEVANRSLDIVYGVDSYGNAVTSGCPYGYQITFTKNGHVRTKVVQYWQ